MVLIASQKNLLFLICKKVRKLSLPGFLGNYVIVLTVKLVFCYEKFSRYNLRLAQVLG